MDNVVSVLTGNLIINLCFLSWVTAQVLKFIVLLISERRVDISYIWTSGGMPSSHSSFVCTCASAMGYIYGWSSAGFTISTVLAVIVMYDASHVRKAAGEQAKILNHMMEHWKEIKPEFVRKELKELLGHTPFQVLMGGLLGVAIGIGGAILFG